MKKFLRLGILALIAIPSITAFADSPREKSLVVQTSSGNIEVSLADNPEITFGNSADNTLTVCLSYNGGADEWAFDTVGGWYFTNRDNSGLTEASETSVHFRFNPATASIASTADGIAVYDLAGRCAAYTEGCELSVAGLCRGIYIAVSANKSIKFVKN